MVQAFHLMTQGGCSSSSPSHDCHIPASKEEREDDGGTSSQKDTLPDTVVSPTGGQNSDTGAVLALKESGKSAFYSKQTLARLNTRAFINLEEREIQLVDP